jgi:uncharacterized protein YwgA
MKLAFLAAYQLYWDKVKALNLRFYRYTWGPYTQQVTDSLADLSRSGMLLETEYATVTGEGMRLATSFGNEVLSLKANKHINDVLGIVVDENAKLSTDQLLSKVYAMRCYTVESPAKKHEVKRVAQFQEFTGILAEDEASGALFIPPGWQITLELAFDPDALRNLQRGIEDTHAGRLHGWEALGRDV